MHARHVPVSPRRGPRGAPQVRLLGSGAILREVIAAAALLRDDWHVRSEVWSVTSFSELAREARERRARATGCNPRLSRETKPRRAAACGTERRSSPRPTTCAHIRN